MINKIPSHEYKKILESIPICCVEAIIYHKGKVLLVHRKSEPFKNEWWFPGGRVYKNERLEEAVIRKTYEEVGLRVKVDKEVRAYDTMSKFGPFDNLKNGAHTINICFLVTPLDADPKIKIDDTSSDYKWINKLENSLQPYLKVALKDAGIFN